MIESNLFGIDNGAALLVALYAIACIGWLILRGYKK